MVTRSDVDDGASTSEAPSMCVRKEVRMQPSTAPPDRTPPAVPRAKVLRLGDVLSLGGSLVVFAFSFAPFVTVNVPGLFGSGGVEDWHNAWAAETFMAPLTWFVLLAGLLVIAVVALRYFGVRDPQPWGFRFTQLEIILGAFMLVVLFGMVTSEKHLVFGSDLRALGEIGARLDTGWGAILMLLGALATMVGTSLTHLSIGPVVYPRPESRPDPRPAEVQPPADPDPPQRS